MDSQSTSIVAIAGLIVSGLTTFIAAVNHKRIRSTCCGKTADLSIDVESTTPPTKAVITQA